jgi:protein SCO1
MRDLGHGVRPWLALALILAAAAVGLAAAGARKPADPGRRAPGLRADLLPGDLDGAPAPALRLVGARGERIDGARLRGRPYLVTFLYTHCVDVCPVIGFEIGDALRRLGPRASRVAAVGVTVDPRRDTPAAARRWNRVHHLPAREFHYAVGPVARLESVWRDWYVIPRTGVLEDPRAHDASVWLVDARGRLRGRWSGAQPIAPADMAHDLAVLLAERH